MKKLLVMLFLTISTATFGQRFSYSKCINNYWGEWKEPPYGNMFIYKMNENYDEFIIYASYDHPSDYILKVTINGMTVQKNKKYKKMVIKSKNWYQYSGTVEYYTLEPNDTFKKLIENWPLMAYPTSFKKHVVPATIKIAPYKDNPETYNIMFEDYGLAIQIK